ncbi:hypothetical protein DFH07DRAFT_499579 [Mycena maculata]|uniref:Secreted protein n=1 Tax=Mycena maculata TaxID=230809 RepID=A0AAD7J4Q5_9AGAR|nr:hypothetical protein DFH07DRAFT_499579 [Mycena maculata]
MSSAFATAILVYALVLDAQGPYLLNCCPTRCLFNPGIFETRMKPRRFHLGPGSLLLSLPQFTVSSLSFPSQGSGGSTPLTIVIFQLRWSYQEERILCRNVLRPREAFLVIQMAVVVAFFVLCFVEKDQLKKLCIGECK